jgi:50S ribosomal subunit-associated GTPase HflX
LSHPDREAQKRSVIEILSELAPEDKLKNMLTIYNKCDLVQGEEPDYSNKEESNAYYVSCKTGQGLAQIKQIIEKKIFKLLEYIQLNLKVSQGSEEMAYLYKNSIVKETKDSNDSQYVIMNIMINKVNALKFIKLFPNVTISK